jgi:hypothetical protein
MKDRVLPVGLKGKEVNQRMIELMGIKTINEDKKTSVVELTKRGPDGKVYGIVRENHNYFIKTTNKLKNLVVEDFSYIGGLKNKMDEAYPSYAKAIKHLNLKFKSLNEAYGVSDNINVFEDDKLLAEDYASFYQPTDETMTGFSNEGNLEGHDRSKCCNAPTHQGICSQCGSDGTIEDGNIGMGDMEMGEPMSECCGAPMYEGMCMECGGHGMNELNSANQAVQDMMEDDDEMSSSDKRFASLAPPYDKITYADKIAGARRMNEGKLSIARSIRSMDNIIDSLSKPKKKVNK